MGFLLIGYAVIVIISLVMGGIAAYYGNKYSLPGDKVRAATFVYALTAGLVLLTSIVLILGTGWSGAEV